VLGHGAHGGVETQDLVALAENLPADGITVIRVEQPWRVAGKTVAPAPATLDRGWLAVVEQLKIRGAFVLGGRSAGARVACRTADRLHADAVVAIAFPLHPPGRPDRSRADELLAVGPTLVIQGERDPFGRPEELPAGLRRLHVVPGGDHGLAVPKRSSMSQADVLRDVTNAVREFIEEIAGRRRPGGNGRR
jgi:predicted alpha/beta-hydrolase family hydrolase